MSIRPLSRQVSVRWLAAAALAVTLGRAAAAPAREQPANARRVLFEGVTYVREVRRTPRPLVLHALIVDLRTRGLSFVVTPEGPVPGGRVRARTTSRFLAEYGVQAAINASNFTWGPPEKERPAGPGLGGPVSPDGVWASGGHVFTRGEDPQWPPVYLSRDNRVQFGAPRGPIYSATAGKGPMLTHGAATVGSAPVNHALHPRTAIAIDRTGRRLILLVVDGRQPGYSEGVTVAELAEIARGFGAYTGVNLDGGGSSAMVVEGEDGRPVQLNSPIDGGVPGTERPVATHIGLRARPLRGANRAPRSPLPTSRGVELHGT